MGEQNNRQTSFDKTDSYLRTQRMRGWLIVFAGFFLVSGILGWLFFGSINITVSGNAEKIKGVGAYCAVLSSDIDKVKLGMTGWIDHYKGTVIDINETYTTYDEIKDLFGYSAKHFYAKEDETYYSVTLNIKEANSGYSRFTIITDTVTPFKYFFGGKGK